MENEVVNKDIDLINKELSDIQCRSKDLKNVRDNFDIAMHDLLQTIPDHINLDTINLINDKHNHIVSQINEVINKLFLIELKLKAIKETNNRKQFDKNQKELNQLYKECGHLTKNIDLD